MSEATQSEPQLRGLDRGLVGIEPLPSRIRPPHARPDVVQREALIARLLRSTEPLVLVDAPAGYGKSILLAQWAASQPLSLVWLQLDATTTIWSCSSRIWPMRSSRSPACRPRRSTCCSSRKVAQERAALEGIIGRPLEPITEVFRIGAGEAHFWTLIDILRESQLERVRF